MEVALLSPPRIYVPQRTPAETPAMVAQRYRLRRAAMSAVEIVCVGLFVAAALTWSAIGSGL